jgi:hypothetical protein
MRKSCQSDIDTKTSINLTAMPGAGVTFFLRTLAQNNPHNFIFINSYEMQEFTRESFYGQLGTKLGLQPDNSSSLEQISLALSLKAQNAENLIIVCNRLDRLSAILDQNFFDNLRFLRDASRNKISMIFVSSQPLIEVAGHNIKEFASLVSKTTYFSGYSDNDLLEIFASSDIPDVDSKALSLAGGHHLLLQVLLRCQNLDNPLSDPMVELVIKDLYLGLSVKRRKILETSIIKGSKPIDQYLIDAGYIRDNIGHYEAFTPLLADYVKSLGKQYLPLKEKRLFKILLLHKGMITTKETICDSVWRENDGIVSDWALNALVYRLRRHSAFDSQRYSIESRKGEGYILFDHN